MEWVITTYHESKATGTPDWRLAKLARFLDNNATPKAKAKAKAKAEIEYKDEPELKVS